MNHKANWKEIEETWIELANCVCNTIPEMPCLHCDADSFKVWYKMKFGKSAFNFTRAADLGSTYYPLYSLSYLSFSNYAKLNLPHTLRCSEKKGWNGFIGECYFRRDFFFKTVKEEAVHWRECKAKKEALEA